MWSQVKGPVTTLSAGVSILAHLYHQRDMSKNTENIPAWTRLTAMVAVDASLLTPTAEEGRRALIDNPYGVPATKSTRRAVLDLADAASTITLAAVADGNKTPLWDSGLVSEKYGYLAELLVANPFVQDQLLGNPHKWTRLVGLAKAVVQGPGVHEVRHGEAAKFLASYEDEVKKCKPRVATAASKAASVRRTGDDGKLFCEYSQATFLRHGGKFVTDGDLKYLVRQ